MCSRRVLTIGWIALIMVAGAAVAQAQDITGTWSVTELSDERAFGDGFQIYEYFITIARQGNGYVAVTDVGTFNVTVSGNNFWWAPASYSEDGGTTTVTSMTLTRSSDYTSFSGSSVWSWTDGTESGPGASIFTATKVDAVFYDPVGTWQVTEVANETEAGLGVNTYQYTITVYQQGNGYRVSTPVGVFNVVLSEDVMTWAPATFDEDGGKTTIAQMSLRISARSDRFSGASVWTWTDGSERYSAASDFVAVKSSELSGTSGPDALVDKTSGSSSSGGCVIEAARSAPTGMPYGLFAALALCAVAARILRRATRTGLSR